MYSTPLDWTETLRYFDWKCHSNVSDTSYENLHTKLTTSGFTINSLHATRCFLQEQLGISVQLFHRCINNYMVFIDKDHLRRNCRFCKTPRFFNENAENPDDEWFPDVGSYAHLHPRALYSYIPLIPRLKLLYANPEYSLKMRYPSTLTEKPWDDGIRDMWEGNAMRFWKRKGFFTDERTVALHFSTDGVQLFRNSTQEVWPFLILNLNLAPEERSNPSDVQSNMKIRHRQLLAPGIVSWAIPTQRSRFLSHSLSPRTRNSPPWSPCI